GPTYTWKTEIFSAGDIRGSTLRGDLVLKGTGDPKLTADRFGTMVKQLRDRGLDDIQGDLILDRSFFENVAHDEAAFDGEAMRTYNVGPDPLLLSFKTVRFTFAPTFSDKWVSISPDVKPVQLDIVNHVKLVDGPCGEWRERVVLGVQEVKPVRLRVSFTGNFPRSCGERVWNISLLDHARFVGGVFANLWRTSGGKWEGAVKLLPTPSKAKLIASTESPPLADVVRDINKFSNNVMARQLFLTLSAEAWVGNIKEPGNASRSAQLVQEWLAKKNIAAPELVLDNGSGLSRIERISASTLAQMLDAAWRSSVMPEFVSSMPLIGLDGTMRKRNRGESIAGQAHVKTGTLNDAKAIAGYLLDQAGRRWIVVMMVNHTNAVQTQPAQDALFAWVFSRP
ncbi:MAG: D-alanyl-D-alanine carboxypeptidase/D-alanyl-D-alanine-endopeptidase, partial [Burkholderiales bacterium]|nr:D-alanyl-D-alanine carboxypeptidase/D-alanyl-D-alanine-endopeptidase [Burkholderiales bacterium]